MGAGKRVRQWAERFGQGQLVQGAPRFECPEGLKVTCTLGRRGEHGLRIHIPKELLVSYLGDKPCWVELEIKGRILYRKYGPKNGRYFNIPEEFGEIGEEVKVTINRLSSVEFVRRAIREGRSPFSIEIGQGGDYCSTIGNKRIPLSLLMDLHPEWGEHKGPAVIFTIEDYNGERHGIKIAHDGHNQPFIGIKTRIKSAIESNDHAGMISGYRPIVRATYDPKSRKLEVDCHEGGSVYRRKLIWLEHPQFEKLDVDVSFVAISGDRVEGIISEKSYIGIDWDPKQETTQKGIFGTKIECAVLRKLGMERVTYDESGTNYTKGSILNTFDVTHFDEYGKFVVEEVKLITSEGGYARARYDAIEKLTKHLNDWNRLSDENRKIGNTVFPRVYSSQIVTILFNPKTAEFTRTSEASIYALQES